MEKSKGFQFIANLVMLLWTALVILPFLLLFMSSITSENQLLINGYSFFPKEFSLESYIYIGKASAKVFNAYKMSIIVTAIGTLVNVLLTTLMAYPLSQRNLPGRKAMTFFVFFTILFSGGLVPTYIMYTRYLMVKDTIWGLIIPQFLVSGMNVLLIRTYFANSVPQALYEAALVDGAGQTRTFWAIALPLGKPIIVTIGTFSAITYWNDWTNGLYYITKKTELYPIQSFLNKMVTDLQFLTSSNVGSQASAELAKVPSTGVQMAIAFVAILPILVVFPFLQKYYQKGISLGAVKG